MKSKWIWSDKELAILHQELKAGTFMSVLAKLRRVRVDVLRAEFIRLGLEIPARKKQVRGKRLESDWIAAMYADYQTGMSMAEVARKYNRSRQSVRGVFRSRNLSIRDSTGYNRAWNPDGTWKASPPKTESEIDAMIRSATRIVVPDDLKVEWRKWSIDRRGDFILRLRSRLGDKHDRPDLPFSANLIPFDYSTPEARSIMDRMNSGLQTKYWRTKFDIRSQGVIWNGRLFFWGRKEPYYYEGIPWSPTNGRPALHRAVWESVNGPIPKHAVVRILDRNPNNMDPSNLALSDKNEICRENQFKALQKSSRELTSIILSRHQTKPLKDHANPDTLRLIAAR